MNKRLILRIATLLSAIVFVFVAMMVVWFVLNFEQLKRIDPIPPDYSFDIKESKQRGVFISSYRYLKDTNILDGYKFSFKEAWLEKYDEEQLEKSKYPSNYKFIMSINPRKNIEEIELFHLFFFIDTFDSVNCQKRCNNIDVGHIILRYKHFSPLDTLNLGVILRTPAGEKDKYLGKIKLIKE